ncbi:tetraspanin-18-like [Anneissia japonica]|uniref:tetraspanin-18-like n=1 Tax=Anneissia japonica TaxID=1529436 RepID=UPI0014259F8B|nr:tetraspanin-18-like [Anneissia japonica]
MTAAWNNIQGTFDCCGVKTNTSGARIYKRSNWYREQPIVRRLKVPSTCCVEDSDGENIINQNDCQNNFNGYQNVYGKGCYDAVLQQTSVFAVLISGCVVGVTGIQLLGLAFSLFVLCRM